MWWTLKSDSHLGLWPSLRWNGQPSLPRRCDQHEQWISRPCHLQVNGTNDGSGKLPEKPHRDPMVSSCGCATYLLQCQHWRKCQQKGRHLNVPFGAIYWRSWLYCLLSRFLPEMPHLLLCSFASFIIQLLFNIFPLFPSISKWNQNDPRGYSWSMKHSPRELQPSTIRPGVHFRYTMAGIKGNWTLCGNQVTRVHLQTVFCSSQRLEPPVQGVIHGSNSCCHGEPGFSKHSGSRFIEIYEGQGRLAFPVFLPKLGAVKGCKEMGIKYGIKGHKMCHGDDAGSAKVQFWTDIALTFGKADAQRRSEREIVENPGGFVSNSPAKLPDGD